MYNRATSSNAVSESICRGVGLLYFCCTSSTAEFAPRTARAGLERFDKMIGMNSPTLYEVASGVIAEYRASASLDRGGESGALDKSIQLRFRRL